MAHDSGTLGERETVGVFISYFTHRILIIVNQTNKCFIYRIKIVIRDINKYCLPY